MTLTVTFTAENQKQLDDMIYEYNHREIHTVSPEHIRSIMAKRIDELEFSVRLSNGLTRLGLKTVHDVMQYSRKDLMTAPNIGQRSILELEEFLRNFGAVLPAHTTKEGNAR